MTAADFAAHFAAYRNIAKRSAEINFTESGCWEWPTTRYAGARVVDVARRLGVQPGTVRTWRRGEVRKEAVEAYRRLIATKGQVAA